MFCCLCCVSFFCETNFCEINILAVYNHNLFTKSFQFEILQCGMVESCHLLH